MNQIEKCYEPDYSILKTNIVTPNYTSSEYEIVRENYNKAINNNDKITQFYDNILNSLSLILKNDKYISKKSITKLSKSKSKSSKRSKSITVTPRFKKSITVKHQVNVTQIKNTLKRIIEESTIEIYLILKPYLKNDELYGGEDTPEEDETQLIEKLDTKKPNNRNVTYYDINAIFFFVISVVLFIIAIIRISETINNENYIEVYNSIKEEFKKIDIDFNEKSYLSMIGLSIRNICGNITKGALNVLITVIDKKVREMYLTDIIQEATLKCTVLKDTSMVNYIISAIESTFVKNDCVTIQIEKIIELSRIESQLLFVNMKETAKLGFNDINVICRLIQASAGFGVSSVSYLCYRARDIIRNKSKKNVL